MLWLDDLEADVAGAHKDWLDEVDLASASNAPPERTVRVDILRQIHEALYDNVGAINNWAAYTRLRGRVVDGCNRALGLGFAALVAIGVFSWAVGQKKEVKVDPPVTQVFVIATPVSNPPPPPSPPVAALPALNPILFETGKAVLSAEGMTELAKSRDYLRGHRDTCVLVLAYTDTRGSRAVNKALAARRAQAVRGALIAEGGISAARIFVAELPETDLPALTGRAVDSQSNRSVQLLLMTSPPPSVR
nr:OmpA family protein [Caballeronia sp. GACF4]